MKIILLTFVLILASVLAEKNLEDCLRDTNRCAYFVKPIPVCAQNNNGIKHKFDGFCDLHNVNDCLGSNAAFKASLCERN